MYYDLRKGGTLGNNPEWLKPHLYRVENMFERNKNYPSVTFWSLGMRLETVTTFMKLFVGKTGR